MQGGNLHDIHVGRVSWVDLYYCTDRAQLLVTAGQDPDDLDHDLSDLSEVWMFVTVVYCALAEDNQKKTADFRSGRRIYGFRPIGSPASPSSKVAATIIHVYS